MAQKTDPIFRFGKRSFPQGVGQLPRLVGFSHFTHNKSNNFLLLLLTVYISLARVTFKHSTVNRHLLHLAHSDACNNQLTLFFGTSEY